jgi:hypothetical protein
MIDSTSDSVSDEHHNENFPENLLKYDNSTNYFCSDSSSSWIFNFNAKKILLSVYFLEIIVEKILRMEIVGSNDSTN